MISYYGKQLIPLKANLHTHSTASDGRLEPQEVIRRYAEHGYDLLALTDHFKTHDLKQYDNHGMLLVSGAEVHPPFGVPDKSPWHVVALNVPQEWECSREKIQEMTIQETIDYVNSVNGVPIVAHPYWCGFSSADLMPLKNYSIMEVFNTECIYIGRAYNQQTWDELLQAGQNINAVAVDDMHKESSLFQGFTVICAEERTVESAIEALRKGNFYASRGPLFEKLSFENGIFSADFTPVVNVKAMMTAPYGRFLPQVFAPEADTVEPVTHVEFDFSEFKYPGAYLRLQITDKDGLDAWSNPIRFA